MTENQRIEQIARREIQEHPELRGPIIEAAQLALSEIEDGASPHHEMELFEDYIEELTSS